tara:strand:+ start:316 stop:672 length:357 start_codon:yes stop_codon:yes gene_type:complete
MDPCGFKKIPDDDIKGDRPQLHHRYKETFLIEEGAFEFLADDEVIDMQTGDFVRVPPGLKHRYQNTSGLPVKRFATFTPREAEALFLKDLTGQGDVKGARFVSDATQHHGSEFGRHNV